MQFFFSDLFNVVNISQSKKYKNTPFDYKFVPIGIGENKGIGSGIYLIHDIHCKDAHRLVYLGMHDTSKPFHLDRIKKHLASLTFRQEHAFSLSVSANKAGTEVDLRKLFQEKYSKNKSNTELYNTVINNLSDYPFRVNGNNPDGPLASLVAGGHGDETSDRRFEYACAFWGFFQDDNNISEEGLDAKFSFSWIDLNDDIEKYANQKNVEIKANYKRKLLLYIESQLIWKYRPIANDEMNKGYNNKIQSDLNNVFSLKNNCGEIEKSIKSDIKKILNKIDDFC